ncbi:hypothetical protein L6R53_00440 [Myxococcota bacterium]|nr:hypothetical protein [Myxococcota bacterium]
MRVVKVVVPGSSRVSARCGDRTGSGTTSLVVRDLPAGPCQVTAELDGATLAGTLRATESHAFSCTATGGALECR